MDVTFVVDKRAGDMVAGVVQSVKNFEKVYYRSMRVECRYIKMVKYISK